MREEDIVETEEKKKKKTQAAVVKKQLPNDVVRVKQLLSASWTKRTVSFIHKRTILCFNNQFELARKSVIFLLTFSSLNHGAFPWLVVTIIIQLIGSMYYEYRADAQKIIKQDFSFFNQRFSLFSSLSLCLFLYQDLNLCSLQSCWILTVKKVFGFHSKWRITCSTGRETWQRATKSYIRMY